MLGASELCVQLATIYCAAVKKRPYRKKRYFILTKPYDRTSHSVQVSSRLQRSEKIEGCE